MPQVTPHVAIMLRMGFAPIFVDLIGEVVLDSFID